MTNIKVIPTWLKPLPPFKRTFLSSLQIKITLISTHLHPTTLVHLPTSNYLCLPTYICLLNYVYLRRCTTLCLPTHQLLALLFLLLIFFLIWALFNLISLFLSSKLSIPAPSLTPLSLCLTHPSLSLSLLPTMEI